ncbi:MAG: asparagine synthase (glutamine-hydrolyzing) [Crocinitomicaceae bacterium]
MCGILGIWAKNKNGKSEVGKTKDVIARLAHRGPDFQGSKTHSNFSMAHSRLSILDTSAAAHQPFSDENERYFLSFNGEIYNFKSLRQKLEREGVQFKTNSDTEVLLHHLILYGEEGLKELNGCFAFIFYDKKEEKVLFARDRMGIKPLLIYEDDNKIILTSELHALFDFDIEKTLDEEAIRLYFRLTYIPAPKTILKNAFKVLPGQLGVIDSQGINLKKYYRIERKPFYRNGVGKAARALNEKLTQAVEKRLVADVPLGTFLSGGVDSSVISAIAKKLKPDLKTFSVGFDHPYFDESTYSRMVAEHIGSDHHEFTIGKKDFKDSFPDFLNALDEPFADSSAFAVYFLAQRTKKEVSVALSGDGADELFAGYRKHLAEYRLRRMSNTKKSLISISSKILGNKRVSRSDKIGDFNRKLQKLNRGIKLDNESRFWEWCCFIEEEEADRLLKPAYHIKTGWKGNNLDEINDMLIADQQLVLPNDMLKKVDAMSMAHGLEVRTPFLDHEVVEFANGLPLEYKLNGKQSKQLLKIAFSEELPGEILDRSKKGFEIPIQEWLQDEIQEMLQSRLFQKEFIVEQGIFNFEYIASLIRSSSSKGFGDRIYVLWSILIFQHWYGRYYG